MSKAMNSPTARILRSSRLFSLPAPLPQPAMELILRSGQVRVSDTATQPYPTRQAITAPAAARQRGDWGLKRPLPEKTNNTSSPHVRINAVDTLEHITDFDSAADHTLSWKKWQEMNISLGIAHRSTGSGTLPSAPERSAFSRDVDNTVLGRDTEGDKAGAVPIDRLPLGSERARRLRAMKLSGSTGSNARRWKYLGPALSSMPEAEFNRYVQRIVESPEMRKQFREFFLSVLKEDKRDATLTDLQRTQGFNPNNPDDIKALNDASKVEDLVKEVDAHMLLLRHKNYDLSSQLSRMIGDFFDLTPFPEPATLNLRSGARSKQTEIPPVHPSGGLSYLQTSAHMENHPVHGPQADQTPLKARVLRPHLGNGSRNETALLGVGGFTARDNTLRSFKFGRDESPAAKTQEWDFEDAEYNKVWVHPRYGFLDEAGKVSMAVEYADAESIALAEGGPDPRKSRRSQESADETRKRIKAEGIADSQKPAEIPTVQRSEPLASKDMRNITKGIKQAQQDRNVSSASKQIAEALNRRKGGL